MSFVEDLNKLDPNNPGLWPIPIQIMAFVILFIVLLFASWKFDITKQREQLVGLEQKEAEQIDILDTKQKKAANLDMLKEQMKEMEQTFGDMLRQLPNETEVAGLLTDISQTGLAAGLEFKLFQPNKLQPKEFYEELPINISVVGNYHQFGEFISGIASLPRIVTAHDIKITPQGGEGEATPALIMNAVAKTYRAIGTDEGNLE